MNNEIPAVAGLNLMSQGFVRKTGTNRRACPICGGDRWRFNRTCPDCGRNFITEELARQRARCEQMNEQTRKKMAAICANRGQDVAETVERAKAEKAKAAELGIPEAGV